MSNSYDRDPPDRVLNGKYGGPPTGRYAEDSRLKIKRLKTNPLGSLYLVGILKACYMAGVTDDQLENYKRGKSGLTDQMVYDNLLIILPWVPAFYFWLTGRILTPALVGSRLTNMLRELQAGKWIRCRGPEHPKRHPALVPVYDWAKMQWDGPKGLRALCEIDSPELDWVSIHAELVRPKDS